MEAGGSEARLLQGDARPRSNMYLQACLSSMERRRVLTAFGPSCAVETYWQISRPSLERHPQLGFPLVLRLP